MRDPGLLLVSSYSSFCLYSYMYRPAEEKSDPPSPSSSKALPRPLVKGEGPRDGTDRFSAYDMQGKGKLTKKELRRAVRL